MSGRFHFSYYYCSSYNVTRRVQVLYTYVNAKRCSSSKMRVLLVVTNVFFLLSVVVRVYAGDKRVIIRVPQRIKHIYHHQVKKVPVYVLLPASEKKSKVLDDLQQVTKVLPCKERESPPPPPPPPLWQDEYQDDSTGTVPKYRYARHYDQMRGPNYALEDDDYSTRHQGTQRLLQTRPSQAPAAPQRYKNLHQTAAGDVSDFGGPSDYTRRNRVEDGISSGWLNLPSRVTYAPSYTSGSSFSSPSQTQSTIPRYKTDDQNYHKRERHHESSVTLPVNAGTDTTVKSAKKSGHHRQSNSGTGSDRTRHARYTYGYKNGENYNDQINGGIRPSKLISVENRDSGDIGGVEQNFIRISYPPSATATVAPQIPFSSAAGYSTTGGGAPSYDSNSSPTNHHHYQNGFQQQPANDNHASSYQYRIQH